MRCAFVVFSFNKRVTLEHSTSGEFLGEGNTSRATVPTKTFTDFPVWHDALSFMNVQEPFLGSRSFRYDNETCSNRQLYCVGSLCLVKYRGSGPSAVIQDYTITDDSLHRFS